MRGGFARLERLARRVVLFGLIAGPAGFLMEATGKPRSSRARVARGLSRTRALNGSLSAPARRGWGTTAVGLRQRGTLDPAGKGTYAKEGVERPREAATWLRDGTKMAFEPLTGLRGEGFWGAGAVVLLKKRLAKSEQVTNQACQDANPNRRLKPWS